MASLSQASHLGSLLLPHDAFQEYAAHPAEWSAELNSKGSESTCILSGLATFLHCAFTAHSDLVVDHWTSDGESSSPLDFLLLHAMWAPFGRLMSHKIMSIISVTCDFTINPGESENPQPDLFKTSSGTARHQTIARGPGAPA
jgi:hypothetical protein